MKKSAKPSKYFRIFDRVDYLPSAENTTITDSNPLSTCHLTNLHDILANDRRFAVHARNSTRLFYSNLRQRQVEITAIDDLKESVVGIDGGLRDVNARLDHF